MNKHLHWMTGALLAAAMAVAACQPGMMGDAMPGGDMGGMSGGPNEGKVAATVAGIEIVDPWARAATLEGGNSAIYMVLKNTSGTADKLVAASGEVAAAIEIHETKMEGDVMRMAQVEGGIEVPAGGQVELKPGGYHVMLIGLTRDLAVGEKFPVTLEFASGATLQVEAEVRQP